MPSFGCQHSNMGLTLIDHCSESNCLRKGNFCREILQRFEMCLTCFFYRLARGKAQTNEHQCRRLVLGYVGFDSDSCL